MVLIVDDNPEIRGLLRLLIAALADVRECASGDEAVALYEELRPEAVLMDIRMDGMDGIEATRRIRGMDPQARVVVVTGISEASVLDAARGAGACRVVSKEELLEVPVLLSSILQPEATEGQP